MVLNETFAGILNLTEIASTFLPGSLSPLVNIFKAVGIIFIIYIIFLIFRTIARFQDRKRLKRIEEKLDILLANQTKKKK